MRAAAQARAGRIRQGGAGEEAALAAHLAALAPPPRALAEAAQLAELLVLLGHEADARLLQARAGRGARAPCCASCTLHVHACRRLIHASAPSNICTPATWRGACGNFEHRGGWRRQRRDPPGGVLEQAWPPLLLASKDCEPDTAPQAALSALVAAPAEAAAHVRAHPPPAQHQPAAAAPAPAPAAAAQPAPVAWKWDVLRTPKAPE